MRNQNNVRSATKCSPNAATSRHTWIRTQIQGTVRTKTPKILSAALRKSVFWPGITGTSCNGIGKGCSTIGAFPLWLWPRFLFIKLPSPQDSVKQGVFPLSYIPRKPFFLNYNISCEVRRSLSPFFCLCYWLFKTLAILSLLGFWKLNNRHSRQKGWRIVDYSQSRYVVAESKMWNDNY